MGYHEDQRQELQQIDREEVIFHFTPLFSSMCSPLARILLCSALFPFCSAHFVLHPCQEVCFSVYAPCHHIFNAHRQQWPAFLNCSSFPSSQSLFTSVVLCSPFACVEHFVKQFHFHTVIYIVYHQHAFRLHFKPLSWYIADNQSFSFTSFTSFICFI